MVTTEDAAGRQQGPQPYAECEVGGLFKLAAPKLSAGIVSPVRGVEYHDEPLNRGGGRLLRNRNSDGGRRDDQDRGRGLT